MTDSTWSRCGKSITRPTRRAGFSLVEILVVLAILGIAATISGMALFSYMPRSDLKYAARNITSLCQLARIEAIKRNTQVAVVFNSAASTCSAYTSSVDGTGDGWNTENDNTLLRRFDMSGVGRGVGFGHGGATVNVAGNAFGANLPDKERFVFNGRGARTFPSGPEDNCTAYVQNNAGGSMAITVHPSGGVMVRDWGGGVWR